MATSKAIVKVVSNDVVETKPEPKPVVLLRLWEVASRLDSKAGAAKLEEWVADPSIDTPPPAFTNGGYLYWTPESLPLWEALADKEIEKINQMTWNKTQLAEILLERAKKAQRRAQYSYSRGRGMYSKTAARQGIAEVEGMYRFVTSLGDGSYIQPKELRNEIAKCIQSAKEALVINVHRKRAFEVNLFFATCDRCNQWVKSGVGQFVWESRRQAQVNAERHRCAK